LIFRCLREIYESTKETKNIALNLKEARNLSSSSYFSKKVFLIERSDPPKGGGGKNPGTISVVNNASPEETGEIWQTIFNRLSSPKKHQQLTEDV
jgi:hypothetical protein